MRSRPSRLPAARLPSSRLPSARRLSRPLLFLSLALIGNACAAQGESLQDDSRADEAGELRDRIGTVFQAEHFHAEVSNAVKSDIAEHPPGSILFWNANRADGAELREVIRTYSQAAFDAGAPPILFSTDYEGGGLRKSHTWSNIPGIQRFTDGFTPLAHGRWLGKAYRVDADLGRELSFLHGQIMAEELTSVGINYPLATVSDLAYGLFSVRGVDRDPVIVADIITDVLDGAMTEPSIVFVTKHFPGLGQTTGDTHDNIVVSAVDTAEEAEEHLSPFRLVVDHMRETEHSKRLSVLCSHAQFPFYDPAKNTTVSPVMLQSILRDELDFGGIALSDAMWMGPYGSYGTADLHRIYLESFLAGMDMLMIPGGKYRSARQYFETVYDGSLSDTEKALWEERLGTSWDELHALFLERLEASVARIDTTSTAVGYAHEAVDQEGVVPSETTTELRARYYEILKTVDARWEAELPE